MDRKNISTVKDRSFITPEYNEKLTSDQLKGPRGWLLFAACNSGIDIGKRVSDIYNQNLADKGEARQVPFLNDSAKNGKLTTIFEDTSTKTTLPAHVAGSDAYVFQQVVDLKNKDSNVNDNFMQLFQTIDTLRTHSARTITAVIPYLGYSRQDVATFLKREASGAKFIADLFKTSGVDNIWTYHPHANAIKSFYEPSKVVALSGLDLFIEIFDEFKEKDNAVVVSTDAGGAKFTVNYANKMGLSYAIANKFRQEGGTESLGVIGDFEGKNIALLTDDESVTAGSLLNVADQLHDNPKYGIHEVYIAISHNKIIPEAIPKLMDSYENHGLKELHVTNTIPQNSEVLDLPFLKVHGIEDAIAYSINRMHYERSIRKVFFE